MKVSDKIPFEGDRAQWLQQPKLTMEWGRFQNDGPSRGSNDRFEVDDMSCIGTIRLDSERTSPTDRLQNAVASPSEKRQREMEQESEDKY